MQDIKGKNGASIGTINLTMGGYNDNFFFRRGGGVFADQNIDTLNICVSSLYTQHGRVVSAIFEKFPKSS
jgi:hypothetical protein